MIFITVVVVIFLWFGSSLYQKVPAGYVAVATLFGEVQADPYEEGLHIPVNPFYEWYFYDVRSKVTPGGGQCSQPRPTSDQDSSECPVSTRKRQRLP